MFRSILKRTMATAVPSAQLPLLQPATLHLKSGQKFSGSSFGAPLSAFGEAVFSTSITSYTESMTDPSYRGQFICFTTPLVGNYGVPRNAPGTFSKGMVLESGRIECAGIIVTDFAVKHSHYLAVESLAEWCIRHNVPAITGVDTRAITSILRDQGTTQAKISIGSDSTAVVKSEDYWDPSQENLIEQISTKQPYELNAGGDVKIAVLDFGVKANILRSLVKNNAAVTVFPWNFDFNSVRHKFDGLFLTNGPGDPQQAMVAALNTRKTIAEWDRPIFGICMGHQVLGISAGMESYRMRFGNRGHNQPVIALASSGSIKKGRVYVTSQNHQYALKLVEKFPEGWEPFFLNCNDHSVEGIKSTKESGKQIWGVQFHPESAGGPLDCIDMFSDFLNSCRATKAAAAGVAMPDAVKSVMMDSVMGNRYARSAISASA